MAKVKKILAWEMLLSLGAPGIGAYLETDDGRKVYTATPFEPKKFPYQVNHLTDNDNGRYGGKGVLQAVHFLNDLIAPKLVGVDVSKQFEVDGWLRSIDSSEDVNKIGANTMMTISVLFAKAAAFQSGVGIYRLLNNLFSSRYGKLALDKLPTPIITILENRSNPNLDFHAFSIISSSSFPFSEALKAGIKIRSTLKQKYNTTEINTNFQALRSISESANLSGFKTGKDTFIGINFNAGEYENNSTYDIKDRAQSFSKDEYSTFLKSIDKEFSPLVFIDPLGPNDWSGWKSLNASFFQESYLVGGEIIGSNPHRLKKAVEDKICSSFVIKIGEVATISEIFIMVDFARKNNLSYIFSKSLYEGNDSFLADLAVALQSDFIMLGRPIHGESLAKYNRMLEIEREISKSS